MYTIAHKYISFLVLLLIVLLFQKCVDLPKDVVMPSWDTTFNLPLAFDSVYMHELLVADDNENLIIVDSPEIGDSIYLIVVEDIETTAKIQDRLEISVPAISSFLPIIGNTGGQELAAATVYNPDPEYEINAAEFVSGNIKLLMNNPNFTDINYEFILPGFRNKSQGNVVSAIGTVEAFTIDTVIIELADVMYSELPVNGVNDLVNFSSQASSGFLIIGKVSTSSSLSINFISEITSSNILLSRLVGKLRRTEIAYSEESFSTDFAESLEDFEGKVNFNDIKLNVRAETFGEMDNIKIVLDSLNVKGHKNNGSETFNLQFNGMGYYRDSLIAGEVFTREFNKSNTNLNDFLAWLPDNVTLGNKIYIDANSNSPLENQVISNQDSLKIIASISAPLHLAIKQVNYSDTLDIDLSDDEKNNLNKALGASLTILVTNHIPLGGTLSVTFMDADYNLLFALRNNDETNTFTLNPSLVSANGVPTSASVNEITVVLSEDEIQNIVNSKYILFNVDVNSTGSTSAQYGSNVRIRAKDFFTYKIYGSVKYRVDLED
ncbi:MAG: hypothetical protein KKA84_09430 [Bacteroidetes bacterium]|nr:hypothetical protein [Bacteroidota bacterium]